MGGHWHMEGSEGRHEAETGRAGRGRARGPARQAALVCPAVESHRPSPGCSANRSLSRAVREGRALVRGGACWRTQSRGCI